jgi:hypothetical protein
MTATNIVAAAIPTLARRRMTIAHGLLAVKKVRGISIQSFL